LQVSEDTKKERDPHPKETSFGVVGRFRYNQAELERGEQRRKARREHDIVRKEDNTKWDEKKKMNDFLPRERGRRHRFEPCLSKERNCFGKSQTNTCQRSSRVSETLGTPVSSLQKKEE